MGSEQWVVGRSRRSRLYLTRHNVRHLSGAASAPRFLGVSLLGKNRGLTPNGTDFTNPQRKRGR